MAEVVTGESLRGALDLLADDLFGMTRTQAVEAEVCIDCKKQIQSMEMQPVDWDEYYIHGLCPNCNPCKET